MIWDVIAHRYFPSDAAEKLALEGEIRQLCVRHKQAIDAAVSKMQQRAAREADKVARHAAEVAGEDSCECAVAVEIGDAIRRLRDCEVPDGG